MVSRQSTGLKAVWEFILHQLPSVITGIIGSLLAIAVLAIGTKVISLGFALPAWIRSPWLYVILAIIFFIVLTNISKKLLITRLWLLRIYKEVSASKCSEYYVKLAIHYFRHYASKDKVLLDLQNIAKHRKHPNSHLLQPIEKKRSDTPLDKIDQPITNYFELLSEKTSIRRDIDKNVREFLRQIYPIPNTYLLLYGYSNSVCQSLVNLDLRDALNIDKPLPFPIFLIQNLQYGTERIMEEHENALRHLKKGKITPFVLPFHQFPTLFSVNADFVRSVTGELIPLAKERHLVVLIGCEAYDPKGTILISSQHKDISLETEKFVELISQPNAEVNISSIETLLELNKSSIQTLLELHKSSLEIILGQNSSTADILTKLNVSTTEALAKLKVSSADTLGKLNAPSVQSLLVVVAESYKIYEEFTSDDFFTFAAIKSSWFKDLLFLLGMNMVLPKIKIELEKLDASNIYAIIDEYGIHTAKEGHIDLQPSLDRWYKDKVPEELHQLAQINSQRLLKDSVSVIIDMGILANDDHQDYIASAEVISKLGGDLSPQEYQDEFYGLSDDEGFHNFMRKKKLSGTSSQAAEEKQKVYWSMLSNREIPAFPEALKLVDCLDVDGKKCFLITASLEQAKEKFVADNGLDNYFPKDNQYFGVTASNRESVYSDIVRKSGGDPTKCILLDNSPSNLFVAKKLRIKTIRIMMSNFQPDFQADVVVKDIQELLKNYTTLAIS